MAQKRRCSDDGYPQAKERRGGSDRRELLGVALSGLNEQFASWVAANKNSNARLLWIEGMRDYVQYATKLLDEYKDILNAEGITLLRRAATDATSPGRRKDGLSAAANAGGTADQRAVEFVRGVDGLNRQFAKWVAASQHASPCGWWLEAVRDYVLHANRLIADFADLIPPSTSDQHLPQLAAAAAAAAAPTKAGGKEAATTTAADGERSAAPATFSGWSSAPLASGFTATSAATATLTTASGFGAFVGELNSSGFALSASAGTGGAAAVFGAPAPAAASQSAAGTGKGTAPATTAAATTAAAASGSSVFGGLATRTTTTTATTTTTTTAGTGTGNGMFGFSFGAPAPATAAAADAAAATATGKDSTDAKPSLTAAAEASTFIPCAATATIATIAKDAAKDATADTAPAGDIKSDAGKKAATAAAADSAAAAAFAGAGLFKFGAQPLADSTVAATAAAAAPSAAAVVSSSAPSFGIVSGDATSKASGGLFTFGGASASAAASSDSTAPSFTFGTTTAVASVAPTTAAPSSGPIFNSSGSTSPAFTFGPAATATTTTTTSTPTTPRAAAGAETGGDGPVKEDGGGDTAVAVEQAAPAAAPGGAFSFFGAAAPPAGAAAGAAPAASVFSFGGGGGSVPTFGFGAKPSTTEAEAEDNEPEPEPDECAKEPSLKVDDNVDFLFREKARLQLPVKGPDGKLSGWEAKGTGMLSIRKAKAEGAKPYIALFTDAGRCLYQAYIYKTMKLVVSDKQKSVAFSAVWSPDGTSPPSMNPALFQLAGTKNRAFEAVVVKVQEEMRE